MHATIRCCARRGAGAIGGACGVLAALYACGATGGNPAFDDDGGPSDSEGGSPRSGGSGLDGASAGPTIVCGEGGCFAPTPDGGRTAIDAAVDVSPGSMMPVGSVAAPDCPLPCAFPPPGAPTCSGTAAPIAIAYPRDGVLLPPNLNVVSVQWTPYGAPYTRFSVDFRSPSSGTDWHIVTNCTNQTTDVQTSPPSPSGGCEVVVDPLSWAVLTAANRGKNPVEVTVRGTTNGACASASTNTVNVSFAEEDLLGSYYYWKSTVSSAGIGGQIWSKVFGDLTAPETDVTSNITATGGTLAATCNGCHALSRDGSRMVIYSDDNDSDDEYTDVGGSLLDMTPLPASPAKEVGAGVRGGMRNLLAPGSGQPPGFSAIHPLATSYVSSNGLPLTDAGAPPQGLAAGTSTSAGYPSAVPTNGWSLWSGQGTFVGPVTIGPAGTRPTMPDWSIDGTTVVYVQPAAVGAWNLFYGGTATDDDHVFGGSLYTVPYLGNGMFGAPTVFLKSNGENNYYPSYSPDQPMSFIVFNRVTNNASAGTTCSGGFCANDSFSNPDARLMLIANAAGSTPIDLEKANASPASAPLSLSNSYPRWAPFVQTYKGDKLLWFTFSSTRDYGVRLKNNKPGMHQCYPPDATETPQGLHGIPFAAACRQPQIWMAPVSLSEAQGNKDPSGVAFWLPYQDITTHNHTAQWTAQANIPPPPVDAGCMCSMLGGACGQANPCGCCGPTTTPTGLAGVICSGSNTCIQPAN